MDSAVASGGEVSSHGDAMNKRGGEEKPMKVVRAMAGMASGAAEFNYTRNSSMQSQSINILKPILEQEIMQLEVLKDCPTIRIADFGCSVGSNPLRYAEICYRNVCRARSSGSNGRKPPSASDDVQYFFCDLPSNDFNTLFLQLEEWRTETQVTSKENFYVTGVARSFYGRLLPKRSLHVAISTFALQWMSQVPDAVVDKSSPAYNRGKAWIDGNQNVATVQAFAQAATLDLRNFLLSRAAEVVPGGLVVIYAPCRPDVRHPEIQWTREEEYVGPFSVVFETTWEELVTEGIIEKERRDSLNVPSYCHSVDHVKAIAKSTNAFHIKRCEMVRQRYFSSSEEEQMLANP